MRIIDNLSYQQGYDDAKSEFSKSEVTTKELREMAKRISSMEAAQSDYPLLMAIKDAAEVLMLERGSDNPDVARARRNDLAAALSNWREHQKENT